MSIGLSINIIQHARTQYMTALTVSKTELVNIMFSACSIWITIRVREFRYSYRQNAYIRDVSELRVLPNRTWSLGAHENQNVMNSMQNYPYQTQPDSVGPTAWLTALKYNVVSPIIVGYVLNNYFDFKDLLSALFQQDRQYNRQFKNFVKGCSWTLMAHNFKKWKSTFLTCPCHKIYKVKAVGIKSSNYTLKIMIFVKMWNLGQFCENLIICQ